MATPDPLQAFRDAKDGKISMMRLLFFLWAIVVLAVWAWVSLRSNQVQDIPTSVAAILGVLIGGKATQRFAEMRARP